MIARRATASEDPRTIVGFTAASMIIRGWLVAMSIFLVGLGDNEAGLAAAVLVISLFTIYFAMQMALRPLEDAMSAAAARQSGGSAASAGARRSC